MFLDTAKLLKKCEIPDPEQALPGRSEPLFTEDTNIVTKDNMKRHADVLEKELYLALGCFWGAERKFWNTPGVKVTAVGYAGGFTPNPTYEEVCTGQTAHTEVVKVIFNTDEVSLEEILKVFWENHDPTQGMRQGNDVGSQYRSAIYTVSEADLEIALKSRQQYQQQLLAHGFGMITTEIEPLDAFYFAETDHQQYLHKHPNGYCGLAGTGVTCPTGLF